MDKKLFGYQGEAFVAAWLKEQGFALLASNFRTKLGEIDVIAEKGDLIVFVEVKTRLNEYFPLAHVITRTKQQRIIRAAKVFLLKHAIREKVCRFDAALLLKKAAGFSLQYLPNVFQE